MNAPKHGPLRLLPGIVAAARRVMMDRFCEALVFAGNRVDPPEYCDEEAEDGSDYCVKHVMHGVEYELTERGHGK